MGKVRATAIACPACGSTAPRAMRDCGGQCVNAKGCNERRCARRKSEDDAIAGPRTQCHATRGETSITFCRLREGHTGLHLAGSIEWGGNYEAPAAAMFRAALAARDGAS